MDPKFTVSEFVAVFNQTLEYAYPSVTIIGELSNFRVSKNKWIYFDLKDESSSVKFFGTIYTLPGPLEDGMVVQVSGQPRLHNLYGFSVTASIITPVGEGSIRKAAALLEAKLKAEGLFDIERKRRLPYPPEKIGLITSGESAAYADFIKILKSRWSGLEIHHVDTHVQGELAPAQIATAIEKLNTGEKIDVLVITRGGGSADDLAAFNNEQLVRAVAGSRVPTLVAIGHEIDISLAELAADQRASTPSNAAELLVPDKSAVASALKSDLAYIEQKLRQQISESLNTAQQDVKGILNIISQLINEKLSLLEQDKQTLHGYDPRRILKRGYALIRQGSQSVTSVESVKIKDSLNLRLIDGSIDAQVVGVNKN